MTPARFLEEARALDDAIQAVDRRFLMARLNAAPEHTRAKLVSQRNALTQQWGALWRTRSVSP